MTTTGLRMGNRVMSESEESSERHSKKLMASQQASLCVLTQIPRPRPSIFISESET